MKTLLQQAECVGIQTVWEDNDGVIHDVPEATLQFLVDLVGEPANTPALIVAKPGSVVITDGARVGEPYRLILEDGATLEGRIQSRRGRCVLDGMPPMGLHRLEFASHARDVLIAPERCLSPSDLGIERCFGVSAQLYSLRSSMPSGLGHFGMLPETLKMLANSGADFLGLNPLHALFAADPAACSPYAPSSRRFLNSFYIDPKTAADMLDLEPPSEPETDSKLVDYSRSGKARLEALRTLFAAFRERPSPAEFSAFRARGGKALATHALFEALHMAVLEKEPERWAFWDWPNGWDRPDGNATIRFEREQADKIEFHIFLQWIAERQLDKAARAARDQGMRVGLYRDLAVGVNPAGSAVWSQPDLLMREVSIGAPPDAFSPKGQVWGLAPAAPARLAAEGYRPLLADLDANARHAGALRIDHVIGLARQFWVPDGVDASCGAYVRYPFDVFARLAALVSHRYRCLVIGEDLGTVPRGFRRRMQRYGMLSCRVLWFEREKGRPRAPERYPRDALASISTHDLPTVAGFIEGRDIDWRERLGLFAEKNHGFRALEQRRRDSKAIDRVAQKAGIDDPTPVLRWHRFLSRTNCALAAVQLEDLDGSQEQPNLPGTIDTHPNWRRRLSQPIGTLLGSAFAQSILRVISHERASGFRKRD